MCTPVPLQQALKKSDDGSHPRTDFYGNGDDWLMIVTCERDAKTGKTSNAGAFHTLPHLVVKNGGIQVFLGIEFSKLFWKFWKGDILEFLTRATNARSSRLDPIYRRGTT